MPLLPANVLPQIDTVNVLQAKSARQTQLRGAASKLVSQTFFGTMLKQMRNSPWKSEMFGGGKAGEAYQSMFDMHLSEQLGRGVGKRLVDSIVKRWTDQADAPAAPPRPATPAQNVPDPREIRRELQKNARPVVRHDATAITA